MITEDYVSFDTAKLLKEKGFNENTPVNYFVGDDKPRGCMVGEMIYHKRIEEDTHLIACPTLQMAMKWLRKAYKIYIMIDRSFSVEDSWHYCICVDDDFDNLIQQEVLSHRKYEEACEAAIKYCLENLI